MRVFLFLFVSGLLLSSCAMAKREKLDASIDTYIRALRHKDESTVMAFVDPEQRDAFYQGYQDLHRVYISNVEIGTIYPGEDNDNAAMTLVVEYFDQSGTELVTSKRQLVWKYSKAVDAWRLQNSYPLGSKIQ